MTSTKLLNLIGDAKKITVLTGAGVSTLSGIPDFASTDASWDEKYPRTDMIHEAYFRKYPIDFWRVYKKIFHKKLTRAYEPNVVHKFLAELENEGRNVQIFTQNVDGLHQRAGNKDVYEMHGGLGKVTCLSCQIDYDETHIHAMETPRCTRLLDNGQPCNTVLKPDVVLFGDDVRFFDTCLNQATCS